MTIEDIKKQIVIKEEVHSLGQVTIIASLQVVSATNVGSGEYAEYKNHIDDDIRQGIIDLLFADCRNKMNEALYRLRKADPLSGEFIDAMHAVMEAAKYQPRE